MKHQTEGSQRRKCYQKKEKQDRYNEVAASTVASPFGQANRPSNGGLAHEIPTEVLRQGISVGIAATGVLLQALQTDGFEVSVDIGTKGTDAGRGVVHDPSEHFRC